MKRAKPEKSLKRQVIDKSHKKKIKKKRKLDGNTEIMISTGSTLLDLAICGKRKRGGGVPGGIMMEVFGPESSGKTVLLCEMGGDIQRKGGDVQFNDPEARLNKTFASIFDLDTNELTIEEPDTVTEVFANIREWVPKTKAKIHGIMTDSLAALSTNMEMDNDDGDKMGMRRAKEFSEGFRKAARILKQKNYIMACSNQIRENAGATGYQERFTVPGGKAIAFYASLRLRFHKPEKVKTGEKIIGKKKVKMVLGTKVKVEVYKSSISVGFKSAEVYIINDYGIDDIRANLQYIKDHTKNKQYMVNDEPVGASMEDAITKVEDDDLIQELKEEVIDLWEYIESKFAQKRKPKRR